MKKLCFLLLTLILSTPTINAQDNTSNLLSLLNAVPDLSDLPQYELVMIADTATDTEQVVYVTLVYASLDHAESATTIIPECLTRMESLVDERRFQELLEEQGVNQMNSSAVLDDETGKALAIFEFHAPLASSDAGDRDEFLGYPASSLLFRWFYSMILYRDVEWLAVGASLTDSMQD